MKPINIISLRSSIGSNNDELDLERRSYLEKLSALSGLTFVGDQEGSINVFFIETGGTEETFLSIYKKHHPPYYLLTTKRRNSLPAALEIGAYLGNHNLAYNIFHGSPEQVAASIASLFPTEEGESRLSFRLGAIGKPSSWLIASDLNRDLAQKRYRATIINIDYDEFVYEIDKKTFADNEKVQQFKKKLANNEYLEGALHIYGAIKRLILKYDLHGLSIRCFDLLTIYRNTACLALAMLNDEGISAGCEGDLPLLLAMHLVKRLLSLDSFQANPSSIDEAKQTITFAHCTVPFSMCQSHVFMTHFESGLGIGVRGELPLGPCTVFRLSGNLSKALIEEGEIVANSALENLCRTQIVVKMNSGLEKILRHPLGNHHLIMFGHHKQRLGTALKTLDPNLELI
jgi:L-fucose isomerase-like protein